MYMKATTKLMENHFSRTPFIKVIAYTKIIRRNYGKSKTPKSFNTSENKNLISN